MKHSITAIMVVSLLTGCIGTDVVDDFVEARVVIENPISSLKADSTYQFNAVYLNNIGSPEAANFEWTSSDANILSIDNTGLARGIMEGDAIIMASTNGKSDEIMVSVSDTTIAVADERVAELKTVSSYPLIGNVVLKREGGKMILEFADNFSTTSALPGLYVYLTNNTSTINNALEVGKVKAFTGAQTYEIAEDIELTTYDFVLFYCKPFLVPVGDGKLEP